MIDNVKNKHNDLNTTSKMNLKRAIVKRETQSHSKVCPLAEHIDLKDHYLAFIELENFGISSDLPDERCQFSQSLGINRKFMYSHKVHPQN